MACRLVARVITCNRCEVILLLLSGPGRIFFCVWTSVIKVSPGLRCMTHREPEVKSPFLHDKWRQLRWFGHPVQVVWLYLTLVAGIINHTWPVSDSWWSRRS